MYMFCDCYWCSLSLCGKVRAQLQRGPFNDLLDMKRVMEHDVRSGEWKYVGTSYSNAQYAVSELVPDSWWSTLGHTFINKQIKNWISGDRRLKTKFKCNSDIMYVEYHFVVYAVHFWCNLHIKIDHN